ncbi:MAG: Isopentenyl-diphosphate delta-isomerase [Chroococcopsis gigantea SAG 12.99]|jgi:isopentenyl-diphosphate delta-isomerase|nr:Isopentenyl-diphosphate delta-isomerase [Chroococcopsis gigantea SAG 12.99]
MSETQSRKDDHIRICLEENVQFLENTNGLESYRFRHSCLPELDYSEIDISTGFLGKSLSAPILISSMTGGTEKAREINYRLAEFAEEYGLAMGVGSQRVAIEKPSVKDTFAIRSIAPSALIMANLGAVQLNYGYGIDQCQCAVDSLEADALILHINPLQECIQSNGDKNFKGLLDKIEVICSKLSVPVIAKEVGNGISGPMGRRLIEVGVSAIDVAGAGGTSWAKVETERANNDLQRNLGRTFADWGLSTARCLEEIRALSPDIPLIASGGLRNGLEVAKTLALGADLAGLALPFLKAADESDSAVRDFVELLMAELKTALFCTGNDSIEKLKSSRVLEKI